jgi:hypothetical protein
MKLYNNNWNQKNVPNSIKKIWEKSQKLNPNAKPFSLKKKLNATAKNYKPKRNTTRKSYSNAVKKK